MKTKTSWMEIESIKYKDGKPNVYILRSGLFGYPYGVDEIIKIKLSAKVRGR